VACSGLLLGNSAFGRGTPHVWNPFATGLAVGYNRGSSAQETRVTPNEGKPMSAPRSVTKWLVQLKAGDPAAAQPLCERYLSSSSSTMSRALRGRRGGLWSTRELARSPNA
jgi:hypothetical protein